MVTSLNRTVPQRDAGYQSVGFLRRSFVFGDFPTGSLTKTVGALPANAQIVGGGVVVTTAAVGGTLDVGYLDFDGTTSDPNAYMSAAVITATTGLVAFDEIAAATSMLRSVPTQVTVTTSATLSAGAFDVIVLFTPRNPSGGGSY